MSVPVDRRFWKAPDRIESGKPGIKYASMAELQLPVVWTYWRNVERERERSKQGDLHSGPA